MWIHSHLEFETENEVVNSNTVETLQLPFFDQERPVLLNSNYSFTTSVNEEVNAEMDDISDISWDPLLNSGKIDTSFLRRSSKTFVKIPWHRKRPPTTLFFASPDASSDLPFGLSSDISQFRKRSKTDEFAIPFNFSYTFNEDCVTRANSLIFLSSSSSSLSSDSEEKVADSALLQSQSFDSGRTLPSSVSNLS
jgi:hypothetical protein